MTPQEREIVRLKDDWNAANRMAHKAEKERDHARQEAANLRQILRDIRAESVHFNLCVIKHVKQGIADQ